MGDPSDTRGQYRDSRPATGDPRQGIDKAFAMADRALGAIGELVGVPAERAREKLRTTGGVSMTRWRIEEVVDAERGTPLWVVTNGIEKAECNSAAFADKVHTLLSQANGGR